MSPLLFMRLLAIGIWAGCVAAEAIREDALDNAPPQQSGLALLHHATWYTQLVAKVSLSASAVVRNSIAD